MNYQPTSIDISKKFKVCVYCGKSFNVKNNIVKSEVGRVLKRIVVRSAGEIEHPKVVTTFGY